MKPLLFPTKIQFYKLLSIASIAGAMLFLWSCSNDPKQVAKMAHMDKIPMEVQKNFLLTYSDSSFLRMKLRAPLAERYPLAEEPYLEFNEGITVTFYNNQGQEDSRLVADYAVQYIEKHLWLAQGNVVVNNRNSGEQLNTEELYWDEKSETIYSDKFVKITTAEEIIMGEGFEADQGFTQYELSKVTGTIILDEDD